MAALEATLAAEDPHLAVTDLAGGGGLDDQVDDAVGLGLVGDDLELHLRHEVDLVLGAAVGLGVAALALLIGQKTFVEITNVWRG